MGNDKKKKKVLRLDLSRSERAFENEECLWDSEISKMEKRLESHVKTLKACWEKGKGKAVEEMPLLSIAIFGSPGSGKSSLLRSFIRRVKQREPNSGISAKVNSLPVIKPNTMALDDNFLYSFIAAALTEDRKRNETDFAPYRDSPILTPLQQKFQEVSEYLQVINQPERSSEDDPLGVSLERLERHESGLLLKEKMNEFIAQLAASLTGETDASVVLLPVDDSDMSQDVLISTFDACWRYLQHPRLIPVFTFTGRLAEELLRVDFEMRLNIEGGRDTSEKLVEAATSLKLTETMALQYMGKLFPVRNRIRLGPAAARVLGAEYIPPEPGSGDGESPRTRKSEDVQELLKKVSLLLFGTAPELSPQISAPLRLVTLRRQLQIVDAMQGAGIKHLKDLEKNTEDNQESNTEQDGGPKKSWGHYFDLATWSLLNTHRDILKEIKMNLDDLYGWTPLRLRQVVRDSILSLSLKRRRKLLTHWRYRTESRRSQMLSLLAANVFRPRMKGEEPTGDNPEIIKRWQKEKEEVEYGNDRDNLSFSVREGVTWFLDICIGFYLPQVMACNFPDMPEKSGKDESSFVDSITGVGWDFVSGPLHAVREAVYNDEVFFSGIVFVHKETMDDIIKKANENKDFLPLLWCYFGYNKGEPWAALSLWRGLGLIGQLLKLKQWRKDREKEEPGRDEIILLLNKHFDACRVIGNSPKSERNLPRKPGKTFKTLNENILEKGKSYDIVEKIHKWLYGTREDEERIFPYSTGTSWETCFIRRLHGKNLLNQFWRKLENVYFDAEYDEKKRIDVKRVITKWYEVLNHYWSSGNARSDSNIDEVNVFFKACPFFITDQ